MNTEQRTKNHLLCRIWGHAWNPDGAEYYWVYHCERCGHNGYTAGSWRERLSVKVWIYRRRAADATKTWRQWLRCPDCNRFFGRHDERFDHSPF